MDLTVPMRVISGLHWSGLRRRPKHDHSFELKSRLRAAFLAKLRDENISGKKGIFGR
jgi:hypothetical protein